MKSNVWVLSLVMLAAGAGCLQPRNVAGPRGGAKPSRKPDVEKWLARETGPFSKHRVALFDGLASGDYEAATPSRPECTKDEDGDVSCQVRLDTGPDADGQATDILCLVDTVPRGPFGTVVAHRLDGAGLAEAPQLSVKTVGDEGVTVHFVANTTRSTEQGLVVGTLKVATLYSQGYSATCSDIGAGGRKTFDRVVGGFFDSLRFRPNPRRPAFAAQAYQLREGDRVNGFRYSLVEGRDSGKKGFAELHFSYHLETNGKVWSAMDQQTVVLRDPKAGVEQYTHVVSNQLGQRLAVLTAKPSEGGRFRLKLERQDGRSDSLESTPRAPLTTELWSAGEIAKVAKGKVPAYRYAVVTANESGEPEFKYIKLSRSSDGVLLEEEERREENANLEASVKDELHVGPDGRVTKEISSNSVSQLVYRFGALPDGKDLAAAPPSSIDKHKRTTGGRQ